MATTTTTHYADGTKYTYETWYPDCDFPGCDAQTEQGISMCPRHQDEMTVRYTE